MSGFRFPPPLRVYGEHDVDPSEVVSAPYRREPYVRVVLPDLGTVDGKAVRWTRTRVLIRWVDGAHDSRSAWVPAEWVHRISRADSAWRDPYDL